MLYPLVESPLPEHVLRAWQRNGHREKIQEVDANGKRITKDRLTQLLEFLQKEVENEERIDMTLTGFKISTEQDNPKKNKGKCDSVKGVTSASVLLNAKDNRVLSCIFCKLKQDSVIANRRENLVWMNIKLS